MLLNTFKGGIHPFPEKKITSGKGFSNLSVPHICNIPLKQHIGNPAYPIVNVGDLIQEGQLIGKADGLLSANVHSSVPGKVISITEQQIFSQGKCKCIMIESDGRFNTSGKKREKTAWQDLKKESLIERIREAGIVGMGGEAFPTSVKLSSHKSKKTEYLLINGAESEPYLTADEMLIKVYPEEIIEGIKIVLKILGINNAFFGIENNKPEAVQALKDILDKNSAKENIKIVLLKTKYPQGSERQLISSILKMEIPSGKQPADSGIVVLNAATVFAIRDACVFGKPLFERFVTVTGKIINKPGNYKLRIGTRICDIIEECGGCKEEPAKIIMGGPMRGFSVSGYDMPVLKGTTGIVFLSKAEVHRESYGPCIRCGRCTAACPSRLVPGDLGQAALKSRFDLLEKQNIFDCIKCGSCSFVCPAKRPISSLIKTAQETIQSNN
ncbi:MAG: electron transport complex subunit RsxC [Spirochaetota bacterium]